MPDLDLGRGESRKKEDELPEWTRQLPVEQQAQPGTEANTNPPPKKELRFTEEELEKIKKEKNWLVEEWKAHQEKRAQLEAELASEKEQSLIDGILENYEENINAKAEEKKDSKESGSLMALAPALPPVSWGSEDRTDESNSLKNPDRLESLFGDQDDPVLETSISDSGLSQTKESDSSATTFISPQSPLLSEKKSQTEAMSSARLQIQRDSLPQDVLAFDTDSEPFNPNQPFRPVVEAPGSGSLDGNQLPANGYLPPEQWPTWRQNSNQTQSAADRIAWLQRQEKQRQEEENRNRPTLKDLDPFHKTIRGSSRFNN